MTETPEGETDCLHCKINEVVEELLEAGVESGKPMDAVELASKMAESLADFILSSVPEGEQGRLIAVTLQHFGTYLLEKAAPGEGDITH
jgi:hypothetical protein